MAGKTLQTVLEISGAISPTLQKSIEDVTGKLGGINVKALGVAAAAGGIAIATGKAVIEAGKYLTDLGSQFDAASDAIRIGTGATGEALNGLMADFDAVYSSVPTTMGDASKAIADYNTRLGLTGPALQNVSKKAIQVADMLDENLDSVIEESSQALQIWKIDAENMGDAMDYVFRASQSTGVGFSDLMSKTQQFGPQLQELGYNFEQSVALIGQLDKAGVNTSEVLGAMKKSVSSFAKEGLSASEGLTVYTDKIKNAADMTEAMSIATEIFGTRAASTMAAAIRAGTVDVAALTAELERSSETIGGAAEDTYDFAERLQVFKQKAQVALEPLASTMFDSINALMPVVGDLMESLIPIIQDMTAQIQPLIEQLVPAITPLLQELVPVITEMAGTLLGELIPPIIEIVMSIVPALIQLLQLITPVLQVIISSILPIVVQLIQMLLPPIIQIVQAVLPALVQILNLLTPILNLLIGLLQPILSLFTSLIGSILSLIMAAITPLINILTTLITAVLQPLMPVLQAVATILTGVFGAAINAITPIIDGLTQCLGGLIDFLVGVFTGNWEQAWEGVKSVFTGIWDAIVGVFKGAIDFIGGIVDTVFGWFGDSDGSSEAASAATKTTTAYADGISSGASAAQNAATSVSSSAFSSIDTASATAAGTMSGQSFTTGLTTSLNGATVDTSTIGLDEATLTANMQTAGTAGGTALISGLNTAVATSTIDTTALTVDTTGLTANMQTAGASGAQAIASGITSGSAAVTSATKSLSDNMNAALDSGWTKAETNATNALNSISSTLTSWAQKAVSTIKSAFSNMVITIPKPRLPVISVTTNSVPYGDGGKVSVPKFSVSWNAVGGIFDEPTIFNTPNGLQGVGEAGAEAVLPLDLLWDKLADILQTAINRAAGINNGNIDNAVNVVVELPDIDFPEPSKQPGDPGKFDDRALTRKAGELLTLDDFSLGGISESNSMIIYYDMSGLTWAPVINSTGNKPDDEFMEQIRNHEAEFIDWLDEFLEMREASEYAR